MRQVEIVGAIVFRMQLKSTYPPYSSKANKMTHMRRIEIQSMSGNLQFYHTHNFTAKPIASKKTYFSKKKFDFS